MKNYKYYATITGLFSACIVTSNILDTKIFMLFSLALPGGIVLFPVVYIFADVLTEVYGYSSSRRVIWTGLGALSIVVITSTIVKLLPAAPFWQFQTEFEHILGKVPRIVLASITAYFLGEFTNSFVLAKMKVKAEGHNMPIRFVASTIVGQLVDTSIFVLIAFTGSMPVYELVSITVSAWLFKVVWEIIALPVTLPIVKWLKRAENEDYFDRQTDFNPFKL